MRIVWDQIGEKRYETGTDRGVVYPCTTNEEGKSTYGNGAGWNGLIGVSENPSGAEPTPLHANNHKYTELMSNEDFGMTISAYTFPKEYEPCLGIVEVAPGVKITQQERAPFGFTYRTLIGNDVKKNAYGYKVHLVYGALAKPSTKDNKTINESPEATEMSWECSTTPVEVPGLDKPTAHIEIDSTTIDPAKLKALEDMLYGTESAEPRLPTIEELLELVGKAANAG